MNTLNYTPPISPQMIAVRLHGAALVESEADADNLSQITGKRLDRYYYDHVTDTRETWLEGTRINVAGTTTSVTYWFSRPLLRIEDEIAECAQIAAALLEPPHNPTTMLVTRVRAAIPMNVDTPLLSDLSAIESNALVPAIDHNGVTFPVWHRVSNRFDDRDEKLLDMQLAYDATGAVITHGRDPSASRIQRMTDAVYRQMRTRIGLPTQPMQGEAGTPPVTMENIIWLADNLLEQEHGARSFLLAQVASSLANHELMAPNDDVNGTVNQLREISQIYEDIEAGQIETPPETGLNDAIHVDVRSMNLLEQLLRRNNWYRRR